MKNPQEEKWEKEFEEKFVHKGEDGDLPEEKYGWTILGSFPIEVEQFIRQTHKDLLTSLLEDVRKIKTTPEKIKKETGESFGNPSEKYIFGYNDALSDIEQMIKSKL